MSWRHFHFNCRFLLKQLEQGFSKNEAIEKLNNFDASFLFKNKQLKGAQNKLFEEILCIESLNSFRTCLEGYNQLDLAKLCINEEAIEKQKSALNYMITLFTVYIVVAMCFKTFVFPTFVDIFTLFKGDLPVEFLAFDNVFLLTTPILTLLLIAAYHLIKKIKNLDSSMISKNYSNLWFLPKKLNKKMQQLNQIIRAPLNLETRLDNGPIGISINQMESHGLQLKDEITGFAEELRISLEIDFTKLFNRYFQLLQFSINGVIGFLIIVMYLPIFSLGALIV